MKNTVLPKLLFILIMGQLVAGCDNDNPMDIPDSAGDIQWQPASGPYGGTISDIAENQFGDLFVATPIGIFRSNDNGENWSKVNHELLNTEIEVVAVNATNDIFVGTENGLIRSSDDGNSWTLVSGLPQAGVSAIAFNSSNHVFVGVAGIYRSIDNGNSWEKIWDTGANDFAINSSGHIFAISGRVIRSTDNGDSWTETSNGLPEGFLNAPVSILSLAINSGGHIFASLNIVHSDIGPIEQAIYRSLDNGNSWQEANSTFADGLIEVLAVNNNDHIFAGVRFSIFSPGGVFRSTDDGQSWTRLNSFSTISLTINSSQQVFAGTNGSGVLRSIDNGDTWIKVNTGLWNTNIQSILITQDRGILAGTSQNGLFYSQNGETWSAVLDQRITSLAINSKGYIFAGDPGSFSFGSSALGGIFRSTNSGNNWGSLNSGLSNPSVNTIALNSSGHIFIGTPDGVYRSQNDGDSWTNVSAGLPNIGITALTIDLDDRIFTGTDGSGVFHSIDNGISWLKFGDETLNTTVLSLASNSSGDVFAGTRTGIFRSRNNGDSWSEINNGLPNTAIYEIVLDSNGHIFVATGESGVFLSANDGDRWESINSGLSVMQVEALAIGPNETTYAGTVGGGVFLTN